MQLIQLLLPLYDGKGNAFSSDHYDKIKQELTNRYGGLTAYTRSPASGTWKKENNTIVKDDIYVFEVMVEKIDKEYWVSYKKKLMELFQQDELVIRSTQITLL